MRDFKIQAGKYTVQHIAERVTLSSGSAVENVTGNQLILALATKIDTLERLSAQRGSSSDHAEELRDLQKDRADASAVDWQITERGNKYTYLRFRDGHSEIRRYGQPWIVNASTMEGSNCVLAFAAELSDLREENERLRREFDYILTEQGAGE